MKRTGLTVALGLLVLLAGLVHVLTRPVEVGGYSNQIVNTGGVAFIPGGETFCQDDEVIPAGHRTLRIYTGTDGEQAGPLALEATQLGGPTIRATSGPFVTGPVDLPLGSPSPAMPNARLCIRNRGSQFISIGGASSSRRRQSAAVPNVGRPGAVGRRPQRGRIRIEYPVPGTRSRLAAAGDVAQRAGLVKASFFGSWTMWLALAATLVAGAVAVASVVRGER